MSPTLRQPRIAVPSRRAIAEFTSARQTRTHSKRYQISAVRSASEGAGAGSESAERARAGWESDSDLSSSAFPQVVVCRQ